MFEFSRGNYEQKSRQILEATSGLSSTNAEGTHLIECLRSQLSAVTEEIKRLRAERDEARREVCGLLVACHTDPDDDDKPDPNLKHIHAGIRGWDCYKNYINYKENTNG